MARLDLDLPLEDSPASRFLLWLTAGLVYLMVVVLAIAAIADVQLDGFKRQPRIVTVALPPNPDPAAAEREVGAVLGLVQVLPGVAYASLVGEEELGDLVQPWLGAEAGDGAAAARIPLPRLIDIAWNPGAAIDLVALDRELGDLVPGATIGDSGLAERSQERLAQLFRSLAVGIALALLVVTIGVVVWLTRLALDQHRQAIDLLRQMGAKDRYVARQLEQHALARALRGALIGFVAAVSTVVVVVWAPLLLGRPPLVEAGPTGAHWVVLAMVPVVTALLTALAARLTALMGLARLG